MAKNFAVLRSFFMGYAKGPPNPYIKVDIVHPDVGLRCIISLRYLGQLKAGKYL
jgi:hypothetical protein